MANYYRGDEIKLAIDINAPGFDIDTDDFEIDVATRRSKVTGYKNVEKQEDTAVVIFKEDAITVAARVVQVVNDIQDLDESIDYSSYPVYAVVNGESELYGFDGSQWTETGQVLQPGMFVILESNGHAYESDDQLYWTDKGVKNTSEQWFAIVDTSTLDTGEMRVIMRAYITDANANDGKRVNIDVKPLGTLLNP